MSLPHLLRDQPIRAFALACVAATSVFLGYLALTLIDTLSSPTWCSTALQAERITQKDSFVGLTVAGKLPGGGEIDVAPAAAADAVADAAVDKAEEIKAQ
jgi:hypothetical protein